MAQDSRHLIEVKPTLTKGLGVFAKANIPRGSRVIAETALHKISREEQSSGNVLQAFAREIIQAFEDLSPAQQTSYLELHEYAGDAFKDAVEQELQQSWDEIPELHRRVLGIHKANNFEDVFWLGSRINHSCIPNVDFQYNPWLEQETFHAVRDIAAEEELTVSYNLGANRTRSQRQTGLDKWGFVCICPVCENTESGRGKERKREQLFALDQELAINLRMGSWKEALSSASKLAALQKSEGLVTREIAVSYHDAARACMMMGNTKMAILWTEKELEIDIYCAGEDYPDNQHGLQVLGKLRTAKENSELIDQSVIDFFDLEDLQSENAQDGFEFM